MNDLGFRARVLAEIEHQRVRWEEVLVRIESGQAHDLRVMGNWTPKDLVGHINGWQRNQIDRLLAQRDGIPETAPWPDVVETGGNTEDERVNGINQWIYDANHDLSSADVVANSRAQWEELLTFAAGLSDLQLEDDTRFAKLEGESFSSAVLAGSLFAHINDEHAADLAAIATVTAP